VHPVFKTHPVHTRLIYKEVSHVKVQDQILDGFCSVPSGRSGGRRLDLLIAERRKAGVHAGDGDTGKRMELRLLWFLYRSELNRDYFLGGAGPRSA
jgi:hypothetical protein